MAAEALDGEPIVPLCPDLQQERRAVQRLRVVLAYVFS
jgi:hypothetical protein